MRVCSSNVCFSYDHLLYITLSILMPLSTKSEALCMKLRCRSSFTLLLKDRRQIIFKFRYISDKVQKNGKLSRHYTTYGVLVKTVRDTAHFLRDK